jgi:hypothetical protein
MSFTTRTPRQQAAKADEVRSQKLDGRSQESGPNPRTHEPLYPEFYHQDTKGSNPKHEVRMTIQYRCPNADRRQPRNALTMRTCPT